MTSPISLWGPEQAPQLLENPEEQKQLLKLVLLPHLPANHLGFSDLSLPLAGITSCLEATAEGWEQENSAPSLPNENKVNV